MSGSRRTAFIGKPRPPKPPGQSATSPRLWCSKTACGSWAASGRMGEAASATSGSRPMAGNGRRSSTKPPGARGGLPGSWHTRTPSGFWAALIWMGSLTIVMYGPRRMAGDGNRSGNPPRGIEGLCMAQWPLRDGSGSSEGGSTTRPTPATQSWTSGMSGAPGKGPSGRRSLTVRTGGPGGSIHRLSMTGWSGWSQAIEGAIWGIAGSPRMGRTGVWHSPQPNGHRAMSQCAWSTGIGCGSWVVSEIPSTTISGYSDGDRRLPCRLSLA